MKFTKVWADIASENVLLKTVVAGLIIATVMIAFALTTFALKEPIVIERGCESQVVKSASAERSEDEVDRFLKTALVQRFEPKVALDQNYFVPGEIKNKDNEIKELSSRGVSQKVIISGMTIQNDQIQVDADRILKVGEAKTILDFPLSVKIARVERSVTNPYGLKIIEIKKIVEKEGTDAKQLKK